MKLLKTAIFLVAINLPRSLFAQQIREGQFDGLKKIGEQQREKVVNECVAHINPAVQNAYLAEFGMMLSLEVYYRLYTGSTARARQFCEAEYDYAIKGSAKKVVETTPKDI